MRVEIEKGKIVDVANYLFELKLARKHSRFRRHFIDLLKERLKVYEEDRKQLLEEHSNKDAEGKAIINNGQYDVKNLVAYQNDLQELNEEKVIIEGGDNYEMIKTIKEILKKFEEEEYEGKESETYDYLCDQFQVDSVDEVEEENNKKLGVV